jgi:hypothetical protein
MTVVQELTVVDLGNCLWEVTIDKEHIYKLYAPNEETAKKRALRLYYT